MNARCQGAVAAALAALAMLLTACAGGEKRPPVVVIGADGLEWSVAEVLLKEGKMPNLQRLLNEGVGGTLETMEPTYSPALWTTIGTGRKPEVHGVHYFTAPNGLPNTSESRRVPAIWNLADAAGKSVTSVAWWVSWPAETLRHGRVVASYAAQAQGTVMWKPGAWENGLPELYWPEPLQVIVAPRLREGGPKGPILDEQFTHFGIFPVTNVANVNEKRWLGSCQTNLLASATGDRTHQKIFCDLLEREVSDLSLVYFGSTDVAGHLFWKYHEPAAYGFEIQEDQVAALGEHVRKSYQQLDAWIGEILAKLPEERIVLLIADHGMRAYPTENPLLRSGDHQAGEPGMIVLAGTGVRQQGLLPPDQRRMGHILEIAPLLCDLVGISALQEFRPNALRRWMTEPWQTAHPALQPMKSPPYRAPLEPREPSPGVSATYLKALGEIGYGVEAAPTGAADTLKR